LGVGLPVHEAGEPVDPVATDAGTGMGRLTLFVLVEQDADRKVGRVQPQAEEVVVELLDPGLMPDGRYGKSLLRGPSVGSSPAAPCTW
jgi:hypothetical protein